MRLSLIAVAATSVGLLSAPGASAYKVAPPGNSAVSQYVESVPGAKGNVPTLAIHSQARSGASSASGALSPSTQRSLAGQGADGGRAAALAGATAPPGVRGQSRRQHRGGQGTGGQRPGVSSGTPVSNPVSGSVASPSSAVLKAVTGSATHGLGALLPAILVASAIGAGLLAALRRRRAT